MRPNQVKLLLSSIANADTVRCIGVTMAFEYADGVKTDKAAGFAYECLAEKNLYEKFVVKVSDIIQVVTQEQLAEAKEPIYISFTDFAGKFYFSERTKSWELSCKATKAQIVKSQQTQQVQKQ